MPAEILDDVVYGGERHLQSAMAGLATEVDEDKGALGRHEIRDILVNGEPVHEEFPCILFHRDGAVEGLGLGPASAAAFRIVVAGNLDLKITGPEVLDLDLAQLAGAEAGINEGRRMISLRSARPALDGHTAAPSICTRARASSSRSEVGRVERRLCRARGRRPKSSLAVLPCGQARRRLAASGARAALRAAP